MTETTSPSPPLKRSDVVILQMVQPVTPSGPAVGNSTYVRVYVIPIQSVSKNLYFGLFALELPKDSAESLQNSFEVEAVFEKHIVDKNLETEPLFLNSQELFEKPPGSFNPPFGEISLIRAVTHSEISVKAISNRDGFTRLM
jgi:hypothetical protein